MIPQFQLPTDNLYKFTFLLFFMLFLMILSVPEYLKYSIEMELIEIKSTSAGIKSKIDVSSNQLELTNGIAASQMNRMQKINTILLNSFDRKLNEMESRTSLTKEEVNQIEQQYIDMLNKHEDEIKKLLKYVELSNVAIEQVYKNSALNARAMANTEKQLLLSRKLNFIEKHRSRLLWITGGLSLLFFILWWRWQIQFDNKPLNVTE